MNTLTLIDSQLFDTCDPFHDIEALSWVDHHGTGQSGYYSELVQLQKTGIMMVINIMISRSG